MSLFALTDEQKLIKQNAKEFAETVVANYVDEMEKTNELPLELAKKAGEVGLTGLLARPEYGGAGMGLETGVIAIEEIAKVSPAYAAALYVSMFMLWDNDGFPEEIVEKYIKPAIAGDIVMCTPLVDPAGSQNLDMWPVFCEKDGDEWVLNGTRLFATNSKAASLAVCQGFDADGVAHQFCVPADTPGYAAVHVEKKIGCNGNECGTSTYTDCRIPASYEILPPADPQLAALKAARAPLAFYGMIAVSTGAALGLIEKVRQYALERPYHGGKLYDMPQISCDIAKAGAKLLMARSFLYDAAFAGDIYCAEPDAMRAVFSAKALICPMCAEIGVDLMQVVGGLGVCEDAGFARYVRDMFPPMIGDVPANWHISMLATAVNAQVPFC